MERRRAREAKGVKATQAAALSANLAAACAKMAHTAAKVPKVKDPKGAFELERLWRGCNGDAAAKKKLAKKLLRPDGKVANSLFGPKASSTVDAETLAEVLCHRMLAVASGTKGATTVDKKDGLPPAEALEKAVAAVAMAPRFRSSAMFLSAEQQARISNTMDEKTPLLRQSTAGEALLKAIA